MREKISFDFRYKIELKEAELKFLMVMPWFMAVFPFTMVVMVLLSDFPWMIKVVASLVSVFFIVYTTAWRTVTINKDRTQIVKKWKSVGLVFSEKKYMYTSGVFFHFTTLSYDDESKGYTVVLEMNEENIVLLDSQEVANLKKLKSFLEEKGFVVREDT